MRRWAWRIAAVTIAVGVTAGGASARSVAPFQAQAQWQMHQLDRDRCWDMATWDGDGNGNPDDVRYDADNDCQCDTRLWNSYGRDWFLESMTFDMNEDGRWEYWLADNDQQEGFDVAYFDDDADGYYDRWNYIPRAPASSLLEAIQGGTVVGGRATYGGAMGLVNYLARYTGNAVWAAPDSDGDGWPDDIDRRPRDSRYR
jgi:hypothetical protein